MKKCLVEVTFDETKTCSNKIAYLLPIVLGGVSAAKAYKNKEILSVDESSKQCLDCPAYFTQEA